METRAIEELWKRYHDRLFAFALSRLSSREEAEDLLQEVFLRLITRVCCLREGVSAEKLLFRMTRNLIIDRYRKGTPTVPLPDEGEILDGARALVSVPQEPPIPEERERVALTASLHEMVETLKEPHRSALLLTGFERVSLAELAAREGITLSAAKSRVQRARLKLRASLLSCCRFDLDGQGRVMDCTPRGSCRIRRAG